MRRAPGRQKRRAGGELIREIERERSRIARELHAGAGQPLTGIKLNLEILDTFADTFPPDAKAALARLHSLTESALAEIRAVSHRLHPPDWRSQTLDQAILSLLREMGVVAYFEEALCDIGPLSPEPGPAVTLALYRCAQEGIGNAIRHSGATRLTVSLKMAAESDGSPEAELKIADNGKGIGQPGAMAAGLGLRAIRQHVEAVSGTYNIRSDPGGTVISVRIPLAHD